MKKIAIVIVAHNGEKYLPECLGSLKRQDYPKEFAEIIVVDNASSDNSAGYVRQSHPDVILIESPENRGFAEGNNIGIREAIRRGADYVALLNQDTAVEKDWLKELIRAIADPGIGAVQSRLLLYDNKDWVQTSGNNIHYLGFGFSGDYKVRKSEISPNPEEIAYASGAAVLLKAEALKEIGLFDESLFLYHEDLDLGWRIRLAGYRIVRAPLSLVYHKYSFGRNKLKNYYMERNRFIVMLKNYRLATLACFLPALLLMEAGMICFAFYDGWGLEKIRSYWGFALSLPDTLRKRRAIQAERKAKDRDILAHFTGKMEFEGLGNPILKHIANPFFNAYWQAVRKIIFW